MEIAETTRKQQLRFHQLIHHPPCSCHLLGHVGTPPKNHLELEHESARWPHGFKILKLRSLPSYLGKTDFSWNFGGSDVLGNPWLFRSRHALRCFLPNAKIMQMKRYIYIDPKGNEDVLYIIVFFGIMDPQLILLWVNKLDEKTS